MYKRQAISFIRILQINDRIVITGLRFIIRKMCIRDRGKGVGSISNADGEYHVEAHKGWDELTFSAIGYVTKKVKFAPGTKVLNVKMMPADVMLSEVVVKPQKEKYSRKNNPAVEFMKKVIEHKKALKLEENDYYQYQKYEKMKMSMNEDVYKRQT